MVQNVFPTFVKYPRIKQVSSSEDLTAIVGEREVSVFEKLDGGNCQVRNFGGFRLFPGSKANFLTGSKINSIDWFPKFVKWVYSNDSLYNLDSKYVLFGEWLGNHTIQYDPDKVDHFYFIDLFDTDRKKFLPYEVARSVLDRSGVRDLRFLEVLMNAKPSSSRIEEILFSGSQYYEGPKEGVVVKDYSVDSQEFYKLYYPSFSEKNQKEDGSYDFLTPQRFIKNAFRYMEEQGKSTLTLRDLADQVRGDIFKEEGIRVTQEVVLRTVKGYLSKGRLNKIQSRLSR